VQNSSTNWDDIRLFLQLTRQGSARAAAAALGVSHSTVVRRVENLESSLGVRLFDRDFTGYRPTAAGETLLASAISAEDALLAADRQLQGQDAQLTGEIRLTTPDALASHFLMPHITDFCRQYPDIEMTLLVSYDLLDIARHEADVAIRILGLDKKPPEDLVGRKLATATSCYFATEEYLQEHDPWKKDSTASWIGWNDEERFPDWVQNSAFPHIPARGKMHNVLLQASAAKSGHGLAVLPTFIGDLTEGLVRIPGCEPYDNYNIWMLSHPDLRDTARQRTFRAFVAKTFEEHESAFHGTNNSSP
jgi:DNA-binding transcriptional LysR family regulator